VAGGAGAIAATLSLDSIDAGIHRAAHQAAAGVELERALAATGLDVTDSRHAAPEGNGNGNLLS
jgi:hypothetical protein